MPNFSPQETLQVLRSEQRAYQDQLAVVEGVAPITEEVVAAALKRPQVVARLVEREELTHSQRQRIAQWAIRRLAEDSDYHDPHPGAWALQELHCLFDWKPDARMRQPLVQELTRVEAGDPVLEHFGQHLPGLAPLFSQKELQAILQAHPGMNPLAWALAARKEPLGEALLENLAERAHDPPDRKLLRQLAGRAEARQHPRVREILLNSWDPDVLARTLPAAGRQEGRRALQKVQGARAQRIIAIFEEEGTKNLSDGVLSPLLELEDDRLRRRVLRLVGRREPRR